MPEMKAGVAGTRDREKMMTQLSVDVLKHLSDKNQQDKDREQRDRQANKPEPQPKKGE